MHTHLYSIAIQLHSSSLIGVCMHSITFSRVETHSIAFTNPSKAFMHTQVHSWGFRLNPMDTCSNMQSMERPHRFALNVRWMFFNILCLYGFVERRMKSNFNIGRDCGKNEIGNEKVRSMVPRC